jgi:hypothetical protein
MAKTIPQLTDATTVNAADELIIQQGGITKRATGAELAKGLNTINGTVNVKDFGAVGDGVADDTAAIQAAISHCALVGSGNLMFNAGTYVVDSILLNSVRNIAFVAPHSPDQVASRQKVTIRWADASSGAALLTLRSCDSLLFENILFLAGNNTGKESLIRFEANGDTTAAPLNKFASSDVQFKNCAFVTQETTAGASFSKAGVWLKSTANAQFSSCIFHGHVAVRIGEDTDPPAGGTGSVTIPDGRATRTLFDQCLFRGNVVRVRALNTTYQLCTFFQNSVSYDGGTNYRVARMLTDGIEEVITERIIGCGSDPTSVTNINGAFYESPSTSSSIEPNLIALNNSIDAVGVHWQIRKGKAILQGNRHQYSNLTGSTYNVALSLPSDGPEVIFENNNIEALEGSNASALNSKIVDSSRTTLQSDTIPLYKKVTADVTLSTNNATNVLSVTLNQINGGLYEFAYSVNIDVVEASQHNVYFTVDGVAVPETFRAINCVDTGLHMFSMPPALVEFSQTDATSSKVVALVVRQVSGTPANIIKGPTYTSWALVRYIGA